MMQALYGCVANHANAHFDFSSLNTPKSHRAHQPPSISYVRHEDAFPVLRRVSLSLPPKDMQSGSRAIDTSAQDENRVMKRTSSTNSMRRSVTGMKSLLPLKLSPAKLAEKEWPSLPSPSIQRSTFGIPAYTTRSTQSIRERRGRHKLPPTKVKIHPERYRDTPIYSDPGSPIPGRAYYTDDDVCFNCSPPGSPCNESCIFNEYEETYSDEGSDAGSVRFGSIPETSGYTDSRASTASGERNSDLSFKCRGESDTAGTSLFRDEAAWLSSSSPCRSQHTLQPTTLVAMPPVRDSQGWLDDTSSYDGDNDDVFVGCWNRYLGIAANSLRNVLLLLRRRKPR